MYLFMLQFTLCFKSSRTCYSLFFIISCLGNRDFFVSKRMQRLSLKAQPSMGFTNWFINSFEERRLSQNADYKLEEILDYEQGWNMIRDEYIKLKNSNRDCNKKSFVLYLESIHNVYNHIQQENEESQPTAINLLRYW